MKNQRISSHTKTSSMSYEQEEVFVFLYSTKIKIRLGDVDSDRTPLFYNLE